LLDRAESGTLLALNLWADARAWLFQKFEGDANSGAAKS
jgi:hypothetical protein